jgi:hypothetical protein
VDQREAGGGGGGGVTRLIRTQSSQERKLAAQAQADQDQADAHAAATQQEIDHVRAQIAAEAKSVPVVQAQHAVGQPPTNTTGSLVNVVCEGWAVAASPLAKDNLRALLLPPTAEQRAAERRRTAVNVGIVAVSILAGSDGYVPVGHDSRRPQLAAARVAAAGKVVFKLQVTFAGGHSYVVYRRWSEVEAMVKSQRYAASYGAVRQALATLPLKYKAAAKFDTATGALACDAARLAKRTHQINTMLAALCACTELVGHIDGSGAQTSAARPLAEFIAEDRGLQLPTGMSYATRVETVSQRLVPSTLQSASR